MRTIDIGSLVNLVAALQLGHAELCEEVSTLEAIVLEFAGDKVPQELRQKFSDFRDKRVKQLNSVQRDLRALLGQ